MTDALPLDDLLPRLRARAADPNRRTSSRPSRLLADVRSMDLGGLLSMGRTLASQLGDVVRANQEGRVDADGYAAALDLERQMTTPAPSVLPGPADEAHVASIEARLGFALPAALRRVYTGVADGGFGPGEGLLPLEAAAAQYEELRSPGMMPRGRAWPDGLLPLVSMDPGWDCVDATGRVIAWDPEELDERVSDRTWNAAFVVTFPTVESWLTDWVGSRTQAEAQEELLRRGRDQGAYTHIRTLQAMTPEQLASFGLGPGWEAEMAASMGVAWPPPGEGAPSEA